MDYFARYDTQGNGKLLKEHLLNVANIGMTLGKKLNLQNVCFISGLLHDLGKYNPEFQQYLYDSAILKINRNKLDHSSYGGQFINNYLEKEDMYSIILKETVAMSIFSHHSSTGVLNFHEDYSITTSYYKRLDKELPNLDMCVDLFFKEVISEDEFKIKLDLATNEIKIYFDNCCNIYSDVKPDSKFDFLLFLNKFVSSVVIEADRQDTIKSIYNIEYPQNNIQNNLDVYQKLFQENFLKFKIKTDLDRVKAINDIYAQQSAYIDSNYYKLVLPTGAGKTLNSLRFALTKAKQANKDRIYYVIPFTTVISQTAQTFINTLTSNANILEHHSKVINNDTLEIKLTEDTWEADIIITTVVGFLDTVYGKGTRNLRRFHSLVNSVIIFDEVQSIPIKTLDLFLTACNWFIGVANTTMVFCTATQPVYKSLNTDIFVETPVSIIPENELSSIFDKFKRYSIKSRMNPYGNNLDDIVNYIKQDMVDVNDCLYVFNTRKAVNTVYNKLLEDNDIDFEIIVLSKNMCEKHLSKKIDLLKKKLKIKNKKLLCLSTTLIEAGVDISFERVCRSNAPLFNIIQAFGRGNRYGEYESIDCYIFNTIPSLDNVKAMPTIDFGANLTRSFIYRNQDNLDNLLSLEILSDYFEKYFELCMNPEKLPLYPIDNGTKYLSDFVTNIYKIQKLNELNFPLTLNNSSSSTISNNFKVIDSYGIDVVVPYDDNCINILNNPYSNKFQLIKKLQEYTINISEKLFNNLLSNELIKFNEDLDIFVLDMSVYSDIVGINY